MGQSARQKVEQREKGRRMPRPRRKRKKWIIGLLLAVVAIGLGVGAWQWYGPQPTPVPAPRFNLLASSGRVITLDEFLGKQEVILIFYMGAG